LSGGLNPSKNAADLFRWGFFYSLFLIYAEIVKNYCAPFSDGEREGRKEKKKKRESLASRENLKRQSIGRRRDSDQFVEL